MKAPASIKYLTQVDKDAILGEIEGVRSTVKVIEGTVKTVAGQYDKIREDMVRLDEGQKHLKDQVRSSHETLTAQNADSYAKLTNLITSGLKEIGEASDKIINTIGLDDTPHSAYDIKRTLQWANEKRETAGEVKKTSRRWFTNAFWAALSFVFLLGVYNFIQIHSTKGDVTEIKKKTEGNLP